MLWPEEPSMLEKKTPVIQNSSVHISQSDSIQLQQNYSDYSVIKAGIPPEISTHSTIIALHPEEKSLW